MDSLRTYLKEIRTIPLLTAEEEIALIKRIRKGDNAAREKMIRSNLRLVINIAKRYSYLGMPLVDLIEEGNMGLMRAVEKFNHKRGFRFSTYAAWWIKQGITRSVAEQVKTIRVPVYMNELIVKWKKTGEKMAQRLKRMPTDDEIAKKLKLTQAKREQVTYWLTSTTSSLEAPVGEEGASEVMELIESTTSVSPDKEIDRFMEKERMDGLMGMMDERERTILDMRFGLIDGLVHTLAEVSRKLKLSRERVRQIEESALEKLKKFMEQQEQDEAVPLVKQVLSKRKPQREQRGK